MSCPSSALVAPAVMEASWLTLRVGRFWICSEVMVCPEVVLSCSIRGTLKPVTTTSVRFTPAAISTSATFERPSVTGMSVSRTGG